MTAFGFLLPTREAVMGRETPDFGSILDLATRAEGCGFTSLWVGDSILARPRFEPLTTLAALATRVPRLQLGTAVLVPAMRQPVVLANEIATLDHISGGRLILGLGIGGNGPANAREFAACGLPISHRVGLFEEGLEVMRRLWSGEEVTFQGRYMQLEGARLGFLPLQRPYPPLWLAGGTERTFRRILRVADGWFPISPSAEVFASLWRQLESQAPREGRDLSTLRRCLYATLTIDDDEAQAEQDQRRFIENYYGVPYEAIAHGTGVHFGSAAGCADWLRGFLTVGVDTIVVRFGAADQHQQLDRWTTDVLPLLADGAGS